MLDALGRFLLSRDVDKVLAERGSFERVYREAPDHVRSVMDDMPVGELRRRLAAAEAKLESIRRDRSHRVRVIGSEELTRLLARERQRTVELREINDQQARVIGELRDEIRRRDYASA